MEGEEDKALRRSRVSFFLFLLLSRLQMVCRKGKKWNDLRWGRGESAHRSPGRKQKVDLLEEECALRLCRQLQPRRMKKGGGSGGSWAEAAGSSRNIDIDVRVTNKEKILWQGFSMRRGDYIGIDRVGGKLNWRRVSRPWTIAMSFLVVCSRERGVLKYLRIVYLK